MDLPCLFIRKRLAWHKHFFLIPPIDLKSTNQKASNLPNDLVENPPMWFGLILRLPSGKRLHNNGQAQFLMGKLTISTGPLSIANC